MDRLRMFESERSLFDSDVNGENPKQNYSKDKERYDGQDGYIKDKFKEETGFE